MQTVSECPFFAAKGTRLVEVRAGRSFVMPLAAAADALLVTRLASVVFNGVDFGGFCVGV